MIFSSLFYLNKDIFTSSIQIWAQDKKSEYQAQNRDLTINILKSILLLFVNSFCIKLPYYEKKYSSHFTHCYWIFV